MHFPGHTPNYLDYKIGGRRIDNVFCGDSLFHVDIGTARCDFPGGNADDLFRSGRILLSLPEHDHRDQNKHLRDGVGREDVVTIHTECDTNLGEPRLLHQSLQINTRGGRFSQQTMSGHLRSEPKDLPW